MTALEDRSLTRGEIHVTERERQVYVDAIRALNEAGVDHVLSGLFSVYAYTGIFRPTSDLDLLFEPEHVIPAARALSRAGFETSLEERHWLAKARRYGRTVDLVFGMANGLQTIDEAWKRRSVEGTFCGEPIRIASPEDLIFHRLFITERHRFDMSDIVHLILARGHDLDWRWLLDRVGAHWRLVLAQTLFFDFSYPTKREHVPTWVREELGRRLRESAPGSNTDTDAAFPPDPGGEAGGTEGGNESEERAEHEREICAGTLISRFSFAMDVNEWDFRDMRAESVERARALPIVREIANSDVWDVRWEDGM